MALDKKTKLYYSIKEVARMTGVAESTLRYWETEFPNLRPRTVASTKVRQYTEKDIGEVRKIYNLVKVRGFKIAAARSYLRQDNEGAGRSAEVIDTLTGVGDELKEIRKMLDML